MLYLWIPFLEALASLELGMSLSQSLSQSVKVSHRCKSWNQGWVKLRIKPFNCEKYGVLRFSMVPMGPVWSRLVPYGRFYYFLTTFYHMAPYHPVWLLMVQIGPIWSMFVLFGSVWSCMVQLSFLLRSQKVPYVIN